MIDIDKLTVAEVKEITRLACVTKNKPKKVKEYGLCIAVLQRGWVYIGNVSQVGDYYSLTDGACIRRWGTSKGLGELAQSGPNSNTALEACPLVEFHEAGKIFLMKVDESIWAGKIK